MDALEKELPNAPDAEKAITGALIVNPCKAHDVVLSLRPDDFYSPICRAIFTVVSEMLNDGEEIDQILLAERLRDRGHLQVSLSEIVNLTLGIPHQLNLKPYIDLVKEKARLRTCLKQASAIIASITDGDGKVEEIALRASTAFDELAQEANSPATSLITSYTEFMQREFTDGDTLAFHAGRGEIASALSVTNIGKSTLLRNAAEAMAVGGEFLSVVEKGKPLKVLLLDFEGSAARFQRDLKVMTRDFPPAELDLVYENLLPVHAPTVNGEPLTLPQHMPLLKAAARRKKVDVIIIDTASAAFIIRNENDNAEIQAIMKSLTRLARELNCLVILIHHIGKAKLEEGVTREAAHRGRGASAWADFATTIFNLESVQGNPDQVILTCAKRKDGENYERILTLNRTTRWFSMSDETVQRPPTSYDRVVEVVKGLNRDVKRAEINKALSGKVALATISRCLNEAVTKNDLIKISHGTYQFNENAHQLIL